MVYWYFENCDFGPKKISLVPVVQKDVLVAGLVQMVNSRLYLPVKLAIPYPDKGIFVTPIFIPLLS